MHFPCWLPSLPNTTHSTSERPPSSAFTPDPGGTSFPDTDGTDYTDLDSFTSPRTTLGGWDFDTDTTATLPTTVTRKATTKRPRTSPDSTTSIYTTPTDFTTTTGFVADITTLTYRKEKTFCPGQEPKINITDEDLLIYLNDTEKETLRTLCWETMFGQELTKLTVMDFIFTAFSTVAGDFLRAVIVRWD